VHAAPTHNPPTLGGRAPDASPFLGSRTSPGPVSRLPVICGVLRGSLGSPTGSSVLMVPTACWKRVLWRLSGLVGAIGMLVAGWRGA
jgi:hypothetical protein